jgi:hypothetical protein
MVKFCYSKFAAGNQGGLRQGMPKVTPAEIRAAVARSAREPAEALEWRVGAATERRRNLQPSGWGGCQLSPKKQNAGKRQTINPDLLFVFFCLFAV